MIKFPDNLFFILDYYSTYHKIIVYLTVNVKQYFILIINKTVFFNSHIPFFNKIKNKKYKNKIKQIKN